MGQIRALGNPRCGAVTTGQRTAEPQLWLRSRGGPIPEPVGSAIRSAAPRAATPRRRPVRGRPAVSLSVRQKRKPRGGGRGVPGGSEPGSVDPASGAASECPKQRAWQRRVDAVVWQLRQVWC